jgi:hypothetical protein
MVGICLKNLLSSRDGSKDAKKELEDGVKKITRDEKAVSPLLEYLMLVTIASVFILLLGLYMNSVFADSVSKTVLENQLSDVSAEISAQMVDMYLLYPSNGAFSAKLYMPEKVGDYEIVSEFTNLSGKQYLVVRSEDGSLVKYTGLGNLPLDFTVNGSIHSMQEEMNITYSTENYIYPTAILIAGPTLIRSGMSVEFDPQFTKTNDGYFEYMIDFGDGNTTSRMVYDDFNDTVQHEYYTSDPNGENFTATLYVWDRQGYTSNDSIRIRVLPPGDTPNPEMFIDKFVSPGYAPLGEPVTIHIFMRGEGFNTSPRHLDVMHVIDVSGSMSTDYMGGRQDDRDSGFSPYVDFSGSVQPYVWEGTFEVNETGSNVVYEVLVWTNDTYDTVERWYTYEHKAPQALQMYIVAPDGSVGNPTGLIFSPPSYGRYFSVKNPQKGNWTIKVIGLFPNKDSNDKLDVHVRVIKYTGTRETDIVYRQSSTTTVKEYYTVKFGDYIPSKTYTNYDRWNLYFTVEKNIDKNGRLKISADSGYWYYRLRVYNPDGASVASSWYDDDHYIEIGKNKIKEGQWRIYIRRNPDESWISYNWQPFDIQFEIEKRLYTGTLFPLKNTVIRSWDFDLQSNAEKLTFRLNVSGEDLQIRFTKASVSPTYAWVYGEGFNSSLPLDISAYNVNVRAENGEHPEDDYTIYIVNGYSESDSAYLVNVEIPKIDAAKMSATAFNGVLVANDSVGLVKYSSSADLVHWLTSDKDLVNTSILSLYGYGSTNIGEGLKKAYEELVANGTAGKIQAIVLLSDGRANRAGGTCNGTYYPDSSSYADDYARCWADVIKAHNITIYTVGLGNDVDEPLMEYIASSSGGYYPAERADELVNIYEDIATELREKAAENITVTDVIPPDVELDPSSIQIRVGSNLVSDFRIIDTPNGTALQWEIPQINISDIWHVSFRVESNTTGLIGLNVPTVSNITYYPYPFSGMQVYYLPNETVLYTSAQQSSMNLG